MQVTKELVENDIEGTKQQIEQIKAQLAKASGALAVLMNIKEYLDKPEVEAATPVTVEEPETVEEAAPVQKVVDANGKYNPASDKETV